MILVEKLKQYLKETETTREEFSKKADIPLSTLNTLLAKEDPNPSYITTMKIARTANISLDEIGGITSKDMGEEEIERIRKAYEQNEEAIKRTLDEHSSEIAHQEETNEHNKEIIRRQDIRIQTLEKTIRNMEEHENEIIHRQDLRMKEQLDRIAYQKKAIFWLRMGLAGAVMYSIFVTCLTLL